MPDLNTETANKGRSTTGQQGKNIPGNTGGAGGMAAGMSADDARMSGNLPTFDLEKRFTYHPPTPEQVPIYNEIRAQAKRFAEHLVQTVPQGRELALALTNLEESVFWANAAIARGGATGFAGTGGPADMPTSRR